MNNSQKIFADATRIKKHYRAEHPLYDGIEVCKEIQNFFVRANKNLAELADGFAGYWFKSFVENSAEKENEPTEKNLQFLSALQSLLDSDDDGTEIFSADDWKELCEITDCEAENLPVETLNDLMSIFVKHGAV
jgi:hypothetical protein